MKKEKVNIEELNEAITTGNKILKFCNGNSINWRNNIFTKNT